MQVIGIVAPRGCGGSTLLYHIIKEDLLVKDAKEWTEHKSCCQLDVEFKKKFMNHQSCALVLDDGESFPKSLLASPFGTVYCVNHYLLDIPNEVRKKHMTQLYVSIRSFNHPKKPIDKIEKDWGVWTRQAVTELLPKATKPYDFILLDNIKKQAKIISLPPLESFAQNPFIKVQ